MSDRYWVYLTSNCSVELISNDMYEDFLFQYDNMLAENFAPFGVHHCGQSMERYTESYARVKNLAFAEIGAGSDFAYVKDTMPADVFLNVRYSPVMLKNRTNAEIRADLERIRNIIEDEKIRFSVSCVAIDADTEDEKIVSFINACNEIFNQSRREFAQVS